jgi:hypothetical protein
MNGRTRRALDGTPVMATRITALLMIGAAVLANAAFSGLGAIFDYPDVLKRPPMEVLALFHDDQGSVVTWFLLLALSAALLAPIALGVGRLSASRTMRAAVAVGVAAAAVPVVGLLRWPLLGPGWAATAVSGDPVASAGAGEAFANASFVLGTLLGETGGNLLTAGWTVLVLVALGASFAGRVFVALGAVAAVLILAGVLAPLELSGVDQANFVGYVLWSLWLIYFAVVLLLRSRATPSSPPWSPTTTEVCRNLDPLPSPLPPTAEVCAKE